MKFAKSLKSNNQFVKSLLNIDFDDDLLVLSFNSIQFDDKKSFKVIRTFKILKFFNIFQFSRIYDSMKFSLTKNENANEMSKKKFFKFKSIKLFWMIKFFVKTSFCVKLNELKICSFSCVFFNWVLQWKTKKKFVWFWIFHQKLF